MKNIKFDFTELKNIPQQKWDELSAKKIFFAHQSLGFNIVEGINDIMQELSDIKLNIKETRDIKDFDKSIFIHSKIGKNKDPYSKIDDFKNIIEKGAGDKVDIAFLKFCYVDIIVNTDINAVFQYYVKVMEQLQIKYPKVKFIHFTVPLRVEPKGIGVVIRRFMKYTLEDDEENIKRNLFNKMLREKFNKDNMLFDIAIYQSTYADGNKAVFIKDKKKYDILIPEYTTDGGHLNNLGRKIIAEKLLKFLIQIQ